MHFPHLYIYISQLYLIKKSFQRLNVSEANRLNKIDKYRKVTTKNLLIGCKEDTQNPRCPASPSIRLSNQQSSIVQASYYSRLNFIYYQSMHTVCIR